MKIYLDAEQPAPPGWTRAYTSNEAMDLLQNHQGEVEAISLGHDLSGEDTGHKVLTWLEAAVFFVDFPVPEEILIHSADPVGRARMQAAIESIRKHQTK